MNDYIADTHQAIYDMVKSGRPNQTAAWSMRVVALRRALGPSSRDLRRTLTELPKIWSDGLGSERFAADLAAVADYLEVLGDSLALQPASFADLVSQAAAELSAAQSPVVLPPPPAPGMDIGSLQSDKALSNRVIQDPVLRAQSYAVYTADIQQAEAARLLAGTTATNLDNQYRNVVARLAAPPLPPAIVSAAAGSSRIESDSAADSGGAGVFPPGGSSSSRSGGSAAGLAGSGSRSTPFAAAGANGSLTRSEPASPRSTGGSALTAFPESGSDLARGVTLTGGVLGLGMVGIGSSGGGLTAGAVSDGSAAGERQGSALRRPAVDPLTAAGGTLDHFSVEPDQINPAGDPDLSRGTAERAAGNFDVVNGAVVTAGPALFGRNVDRAGSPWEAVAGVGGIAALAVGAAFLARGAAGVTANGGVGLNSGGWGSNANAVLTGGSTNAIGSGSAGGTSNAGQTSGVAIRGGQPGATGSMVQGGQIGQSGRPVPGSPGYAPGRPAAPGSVIGGEHSYRVTWLVEDRDLYGIGPSVAPVIASAADNE